MANDLFYYLRRVQREAGLTVSATFPASPSDEEQLVIDGINATLRYLNNKYYLSFKQTEYTLTPTAGVASYDLRQAPYNQTYWRVMRLARNGVLRTVDDYPLMYIDYAERDWLQPNLTAQALPTHYSAFGENLIIYPAPSNGTLKIRYYSRHIGTDSAGAVNKMSLVNTDDVTMLEDEWEDALAYGAAARVRRQQKTDEKYAELKNIFADYENIFVDMMQPGEDASPCIKLGTSTESYLDRKIGSFFSPSIGG